MSPMPLIFRKTSSNSPGGSRLPAIIRLPPRWPGRPGRRRRWPAVEEVAGQGVRGFVDGLEVRLGRPSFCGADQIANEILWRDPEASVVAFRHGESRHVFAVRQRLRSDAADAIAALLNAGIEARDIVRRSRACRAARRAVGRNSRMARGRNAGSTRSPASRT